MCDGRNSRIGKRSRGVPRKSGGRTSPEITQDRQENGAVGTGDIVVPVPDGIDIVQAIGDIADIAEGLIEKHPKSIKLLEKLLGD